MADRPSAAPSLTPSPPPESMEAGFRGALAVVILPTLNEEEGLARTLGELPFERFDEPGHRVQTLVIDGGSTDSTLEVARRWEIPVLHQTSRGKGGAMLEAIAWVHRLGIPFVVVLDADATYSPDRILPALELLRGGTDLVIGVRRPVWGPPSDLKDLVHRVGNLAMSYGASLLTRRPILDLCSGFWAVSTERFMELRVNQASFSVEAELVLKSIRSGLSIHQIPVDFRERVGQAKLRALRDGSRIIATILRQSRGSAPPGATRPVSRPVTVSWGRDLLSIGLALGLSGAVLDCGPSGAPEARRIAQYLRRSLPETRVRVDTGIPANSAAMIHSPARAGTPGYLATPPRSPLRVSLPAIGPDTSSRLDRPATVSIRSRERNMTIELPAETSLPLPGASPSIWSRSGAVQYSGTRPAGLSPSLLILSSRLNFHRDHQQATLLSANGFRFHEHPRNPEKATIPAPLPEPSPTM